jgi:diguanylate cyclase (GGDEF)-like protein
LLQDSERMSSDSEIERHSMVVNLFSLVGMFLTGALGALSLFNGNLPLGFFLVASCTIFGLAYCIHKKTGNSSVASTFIIYLLYALMVYLVYTGGVENTGPLWIFLVSPVSLFLHGLRKGLIDISCFLVIICVVMFSDAETFSNVAYAAEFKLRLIFSFLTVTFLSACYEYSREQSYKNALRISNQYEQLAFFDQLTKLSNRRGAIQKLEFEQTSIARSNDPLSVILCDVDYFKSVNDQYGHNAGDAVLVRLGELFTKLIRQQDTVARWGGEEFLFVLPQTTAENAAILAKKIHHVLQDEVIHFQDFNITITVSMGIEQMNANQAIDDVISKADKYLYQAKHAGRNRTFPVFSDKPELNN